MTFYNLISNICLLIAVMLASDSRIAVRDSKRISSYSLIAAAFVIRLAFQPISMLGYNVWLVLVLVLLIHLNSRIQYLITDIREELGFWNYLMVVIVGLVGFHMIHDMVRLLLPVAIIVAVIILLNTKKSSQQ